MKAGVLFSGGKDSSLAAILLSTWYEVELNTFRFSQDADIDAVRKAAKALGFPHHVRRFREGLLSEAVDLIIREGFPNNAIQQIHREAIRCLCDEYEVIADGTRFGDRIPLLTDDEIRSIGDRYTCSYVRPLIGFPKKEVERLVSRYLIISYGETGEISNGDYETGIRRELIQRGLSPESFFPPAHQQSLVTGRKPNS
ncbi:MAG TPA: asparagine synthase-related protein [Methanospirillum sp.]|uniref:DUF7411 family protein n=1 Tax=Methanospirillum sp. TaxID=45200 RepID=UPI002C2BC309|nr:asparagine synthase-related protein [Methanospirillum sp.]HOJ96806.1 asparagine synthase-related protein [Methanospirillum sp.]HOL41735.1 asparagine synthase-related protein [Methanospirillum sp.]HPP78131.1 asparagine synthase-related protein [Methanospirillum sp.]